MKNMTHRLPFAKYAVALALLLTYSACNQIWDRSLGSGQSLGEALESLSHADRMTIKDRARDKVMIETRDPAVIADTLTLFKRYPDGWVAFSGAGGDYDIFLYSADRLIGRLGLTASSRVRPGEDTLNIDNRFRRVPASDLVELARRLQLPWPTPAAQD